MTEGGTARGRYKVWLPLMLAAVMILGMVFGYRLHDTLKNRRDPITFVTRTDRLEELINLIQNRYVDSISSDALYRDAVRGILTHLDPHTVYIPAEELAAQNEDLDGSIYGIGIEYKIVHDTIQVSGVIPGGPAEKAGIIVSDKILRINDSIVAGAAFYDVQKVQRLIRGSRKSSVRLSVLDIAKGSVREVIAERDAVAIHSVDAALMLDSTVALIRINRFSANTYDEFVEALENLKKKGAKALVVDLRDNPGGYLDAAVQLADELLSGEKLLVYTKGLHSEKSTYRAGNPGLFETGPLAILINEGSASASEIVAGAVQDWDRGIVIGRRSFGKGLVQEQFDLDDGSALRLTIARYYTPAGRSIQRPFDEGRDAYNVAQYYRLAHAGDTQDSTAADTTRYYTHNRRVVYGGGGILPDVVLPKDTVVNGPYLNMVLLSDGMQQAVWDYFAANKSTLASISNAAQFAKGFKDHEAILARFKLYATPAELVALNRVLALPVKRRVLETAIAAQIAGARFRQAGYFAVYWPLDQEITTAVRYLHDAARLKQIIGRQAVQPGDTVRSAGRRAVGAEAIGQ